MRRCSIIMMTVVLWSCGPAATRDGGSSEGVGAETFSFADRAEALGLHFVHQNGMTGRLYFPEVMGAGVALIDFDGDGDLDVFLPQGHLLADAPGGGSDRPRDRLFRNDLLVADGQRRLAFTDVTELSSIESTGYGMGATVGDIDNDGWAELYITNLGPNQMWRNQGDGTFADITVSTGTGDPSWSVSAAFLDFDRDGWLDLYVVNYVEFSVALHHPCKLPTGRLDYCGPMSYDSQADRLWRNLGVDADGVVRFEDVSLHAGILAQRRAGLGVVTADFDDDGWIDLYVANDRAANFLWMNQRDGTFENTALLAGAAVNSDGLAEASMGTAAGDVDGDGDEDLLITHLEGETHTLYLNDGHGFFEDRTIASHLATASLDATGFGTAMVDLDGDGALDLLAVNGAVALNEVPANAGDPFPLRQPNQVFRNLGGREVAFAEVNAQAGAGFGVSGVSRGLAVGDLDNDGDPDAVISNNGGPVSLLLNETRRMGHWLGVRMLAGPRNRDVLGTRVEVVLADGRRLLGRVRTDSSYGSAIDPRVLFGLGASAEVTRVETWWTDGRREAFEGLEVDRYMTLVEGTGRPLSEPESKNGPAE